MPCRLYFDDSWIKRYDFLNFHFFLKIKQILCSENAFLLRKILQQLHMATFGCLSSWIWNISRRWGSQKISIFITWHDFDDHWDLRALKRAVMRAKSTPFWYAQHQIWNMLQKYWESVQTVNVCKHPFFKMHKNFLNFFYLEN